MEKREGTEDRRIRRTRKQIQDAFIALTIEEGFASVTVHSITERADINRSTFIATIKISMICWTPWLMKWWLKMHLSKQMSRRPIEAQCNC